MTVTDASTIAQLTALDAKANVGTVSATAVNDTAANLAANAGGYIVDGVNVSVSDAATLAQLTTIDGLNGNGTLTYGSVTDTASNFADSEGNAAAATTTYLSGQGNHDVTVTDAATIAQLTTIDGANGSGALTYSAIADTAANLATNTGGYLRIGMDTTVNGTATIAQLTAIDAANGGADVNYTAVVDTALTLANNTDGYIFDGIDTTVTDNASAVQLGDIDAANGTGKLILGAGADAVTIDLGDSEVTSVILGGSGNHVITAGAEDVLETFILAAEQNGGSTINGLAAGDSINIDGSNLITALTGGSLAAVDVDAVGEWGFNDGVLTFYNDVHEVVESITLTGVTELALQAGGDMFVVG